MLSLHDALPIWLHPTSSPSSWHKSACASIESILRFNLRCSASCWSSAFVWERWTGCDDADSFANGLYETEAPRSEEHTSELQSLMAHLVCRLLLEKKTETALEN